MIGVQDQTITFNYFEKEMRNQQVVHKDSAMGKHQKYCILANELTRRLLNTDVERPEDEVEDEVTVVIEHYTTQLKNSGWNVKEAREMVVSGYIGWKRRLARRLKKEWE